MAASWYVQSGSLRNSCEIGKNSVALLTPYTSDRVIRSHDLEETTLLVVMGKWMIVVVLGLPPAPFDSTMEYQHYDEILASLYSIIETFPHAFQVKDTAFFTMSNMSSQHRFLASLHVRNAIRELGLITTPVAIDRVDYSYNLQDPQAFSAFRYGKSFGAMLGDEAVFPASFTLFSHNRNLRETIPPNVEHPTWAPDFLGYDQVPERMRMTARMAPKSRFENYAGRPEFAGINVASDWKQWFVDVEFRHGREWLKQVSTNYLNSVDQGAVVAGSSTVQWGIATARPSTVQQPVARSQAAVAPVPVSHTGPVNQVTYVAPAYLIRNTFTQDTSNQDVATAEAVPDLVSDSSDSSPNSPSVSSSQQQPTPTVSPYNLRPRNRQQQRPAWRR